MRDELLGYLLNDLSAEQRSRVEARLESDPIWQHELNRLRQCMKAYEVDPEACPPEDLVNRTCSFVQKAVENVPDASTTPQVAPASLTESQDPSSSRRRWSRADIAVGGGIFLALVMLALPALSESREAARQLRCQNNLRDLGAALGDYAEQLGGQLPKIRPGENAGVFVIELADRGLLTREELQELLVCPSTPLAALATKAAFANLFTFLIPSLRSTAAVKPPTTARANWWATPFSTCETTARISMPTSAPWRNLSSPPSPTTEWPLDGARASPAYGWRIAKLQASA